jgi:hypothetical protein
MADVIFTTNALNGARRKLTWTDLRTFQGRGAFVAARTLTVAPSNITCNSFIVFTCTSESQTV